MCAAKRAERAAPRGTRPQPCMRRCCAARHFLDAVSNRWLPVPRCNSPTLDHSLWRLTPFVGLASACSTPPSPHWQTQIPALVPLKKLKVADLRTLCGTCNVVSTGNKDVLVKRLDDLRNGSPEKAAAPRPFVGAPSTAARSGAATPNLLSTPKQRAGIPLPHNLICRTHIV